MILFRFQIITASCECSLNFGFTSKNKFDCICKTVEILLALS